MNRVVTSRDAILTAGRKLLMENGGDVGIRAVATACGISVGSVYNYFGSKSELTAAVIESIWAEIFRIPPEISRDGGLAATIAWLYGRMESSQSRYPGFFAIHAVAFFGNEKSLGRERMEHLWRDIRRRLGTVLEGDANVRPGAFDGAITRDGLISLIFSAILSAMLTKDYDCSALVEMIRRSIYCGDPKKDGASL